MSSLRDLVKGGLDDPKVLGKAIPELIEVCPLVGEMLTGVAAKGTDEAIPKYYLSFSLESDGLVCRCAQKGCDEAIYVKIEDALTAWMSLENSLGNGKFTRRKVPKQSITY